MDATRGMWLVWDEGEQLIDLLDVSKWDAIYIDATGACLATGMVGAVVH